MPLSPYGSLAIELPDTATAADDDAWGGLNNLAHRRSADTLQGIYPPARFLGSDTAKLNAAIDAAYQDGGGFVDVVGAITVDEPIIRKPGVHLRGRGPTRAVITPDSDWGNDVWCLDYDVANLTALGDAGSIRNLMVSGPGGAATPVIGSRNCGMGGVRLGSHEWMDRVVVSYFGDGLVLPWDHNLVHNCLIQANFDGIEYPDYPPVGGGTGSGGDHCFIGGGAVHNRRASVVCKGSNTMFGDVFANFKLCYGPIGLLREDGAAVSTTTWMANCKLLGVTWEAVGNAAIWDRSTGSGVGANSMVECTVDSFHGISNSGGAFRDPGLQHDALCIVRNMRGNDFHNSHQPFVIPVGGDHVWEVNGVQCLGNRQRATLGQIPTGVGEYMRGTASHRGWTVDYGGRKNEAAYVIAAVTAGDLLGVRNGGLLQRLTTDTFGGVATTDAAALGDIVMVAPPGERNVAVQCDVAVTFGQKLYRLAGTAHHASNVVNGDPIGIVVNSGGPGLVTVDTRP